MRNQTPWLETARSRLLGLRRTDGGWSYRSARGSAVEPSSLAALALLATEPDPDSAVTRGLALAAGRWIATQAVRRDGSTAVATGSLADSPGWTTPFALLLWNALGGFEQERAHARAWLLSMKGKPGEPVPNNPMGHDVTLIGWPWVDGTHSWVEPTAASLLALAPCVSREQPRVLAGVQVLLDRAIPTGGWNLGNPVVFGQTFRPMPGPSGLAALALARVAPISVPPATIQPALAYLKRMIAQTAAPTSLGWAALGLRAWTIDPATAAALDDALGAAATRCLSRTPTAGELAMLLLAGGQRSLAVLGFPSDHPADSTR